MADETRNANVVVSADVSGYSQGTQQAYTDTNKLIESINKLSASLDGITKRVGKKIMIFAAADLAAATAMVTVTAKYEKQLATLNAQMTLSGKNLSIYKKGIDDIARAMPATREELTQLATQIHELGVSSEREAVKMVRTFTQLGAATGESVSGLTQGLIELSRQMGTLNNGAQGIQSFSDSLTMVASSAGVSATAVLNFAQSISPFARAAGLGQKELLGISAAFTRAGADGFAAANAFNSILADITRQVQTGSPEIAKYANVVGMTVDQFKNLGPAEQLTTIFEAVNAAGPDAIKILDRLGIDGIRAAKAIQSVSNEQGGLRKAIEESTKAYGGGATQKGADAAFDTLDSKATKLRNNLTQVASSIGEGVMPFAKLLLDTFNMMLDAVNKIAGPLLTLGGALAAILAPVTGAIGALTSMMGPLSSAMIAMTLFRLSPARSLIAGFQRGRGAPETDAMRGAAAGPWYMRGPYALGQIAGHRAGPYGGAVGQLSRVDRMITAPVRWALERNPLGLSVAQLADANSQMYRNAAMRQWWRRQSFLGEGLGAAGSGVAGFGRAAGAAIRHPINFFRGLGDGGAANAAMTPGGTAPGALAPGVMASGKGWVTEYDRKQAEKLAAVQAANSAATTTNTAAKAGNTGATNTNTTVMGSLARSAGVATRALLSMQLAAAKFGLSIAGQGIMSAGKGLLGMVGGMVGASGPAAPIIGAAIAAGATTYALVNKQRELSTANIIDKDTPRNIAATNAGLGLATDALGDFTDIVKTGSDKFNTFVSVTDAMSSAIVNATTALGGYTDENVKKLYDEQQAVGYLQAQGKLNPDQAASLAADVNKRFGPIAGKEVLQQYLGLTNGGANPYEPGMFSRMTQGAVSTQANNQGFEGPFHLIGQYYTSDDMSKQVEQAWAAAFEDLGNISKTKSSGVVSLKLGDYINQALAAAFDEQDGSQSLGFAPAAGKVQEQMIKQLESAFGAEGNFTATPLGIRGGGGYMTTSGDVFTSLFDNSNDSPLAVKFREWANANNMTAADFTGAGPAKLGARAAKGMSGTEYSSWERGVRGTNLGKFSRENKMIEAVTSGSLINDPGSVQRSIKLMADEATKNGAAVSSSTTELQKLKQAVNDVNDPLYQMANAVLAVIERQTMYHVGVTGSQFDVMQAQMDKNNAIIANPVNTPEGQTQWNDAVASNTEIQKSAVDMLKQYNQMFFDYNKQQEYATKDHNDTLFQMNKDYQLQTKYAEQDFYLQRSYAMQDFARSMKRAAEDAAKSMYNPFQRAANPGTASSLQVSQNLSDQLKRIKDQVKNLAILKKRGLSQSAIDTLNLTDPSMSWQVERWVSEGTAFDSRSLNKYGGAARTKAAGGLIEEQQGTTRAREDFERSMKRSDTAFEKSLTRAHKAYDTALWRMENSYDKSVTRSKQALIDYGRTLMGTVDQQIADTAARVYEALGIGTTDFLTNLTNFINGNGVTENAPNPEWPFAPAGEGKGRPATQTKDYDAPVTQKTGIDNAYRAYGKWWGRTVSGETFRLPDDWMQSGEGLSPLAKSARWQIWQRAAMEANVQLAAGGITKGKTFATIGEAGQEAVIPLNRAGGQFLGKIYSDITMEMVKQSRTSGYNTQGAYGVNGGAHSTVNNVTNVNIAEIKAQNLDEITRQAKQRERLTNMRKGANASF